MKEVKPDYIKLNNVILRTHMWLEDHDLKPAKNN